MKTNEKGDNQSQDGEDVNNSKGSKVEGHITADEQGRSVSPDACAEVSRIGVPVRTDAEMSADGMRSVLQLELRLSLERCGEDGITGTG